MIPNPKADISIYELTGDDMGGQGIALSVSTFTMHCALDAVGAKWDGLHAPDELAMVDDDEWMVPSEQEKEGDAVRSLDEDLEAQKQNEVDRQWERWCAAKRSQLQLEMLEASNRYTHFGVRPSARYETVVDGHDRLERIKRKRMDEFNTQAERKWAEISARAEQEMAHRRESRTQRDIDTEKHRMFGC